MMDTEARNALEERILSDIRDAADEIGPFFAWQRFMDWQPILESHFAGYEASGESGARGAAQSLVKIKLPELRTQAEKAFPELCEARFAGLMNEITAAAWDLVGSIDGVPPSRIVQDGRMLDGPWVGYIKRLSDLRNRASFEAVSARIGHKPSDHDEDNAKAKLPPMTPAVRAYLGALGKACGAMMGTELAASAGFKEYRGPLAKLVKYGYARKPSERGGYVITAKGREALMKLRP